MIEWAPLETVVSRFLAGEVHNGALAVGVLAAYAVRRGRFAPLRGAGAPEL
jgi:hypothetical protein